MIRAVEAGDVEALKALKAEGVPVTTLICDEARSLCEACSLNV